MNLCVLGNAVFVYYGIVEQSNEAFEMSMSLYMPCHELATLSLLIRGKNVFSV